MSLFGFLRQDSSTSAHGAIAREIVRAGDFTIDIHSREVKLNEVRLDLTAAEFDLLLYLIAHPGKHVLTPKTYLATRHPENGERRRDLLRVLLALRAKIEAAESGQRHIRTEPWIVYRFDCGV